MDPQTSDNSKYLKIIGAAVIIIVAVFSIWEFGLKPKQTSTEVATSQISPQPTNSLDVTPTEAMAVKYKDGTYSAKGQYQNPSSLEEVDVTITLVDGKVTDATFAGTPDVPTTKLMQGKFSEGFEEEVVGRQIDEIALTVVNGSSLTPKGFMDALNKIKEEAKS